MHNNLLFDKNWTHTKELFVNDIPCLFVENLPVLMQVIGYAKYISDDKNIKVYYRGQGNIHGSLKPTLFRGASNGDTSRRGKQKRLIDFFRENSVGDGSRITGKSFSGIEWNTFEALIQHYGISTTWIDVVDNIWIAIWFATHQVNVSSKDPRYVQYSLRKKGNKKYGYILLICNVDIQNHLTEHKFHDVNDIEFKYSSVIDLRNKVPSYFIRPHAQHGLSLRPKDFSGNRDYKDHIFGVVAFNIESALSWLGVSELTKVGYMFPPPPFDDGYLELLKVYENIMASEQNKNQFSPDIFGCINYVWPG